jgi:hypothetical protein
MKAARAARYVVFAVALAAAGCSEPEAVRVLDEPKPTAPAPRTISPEDKKFRTLAAMVPADGAAKDTEPHWWFFKLSGPAALIAKHEADFNKLIESVRANPDAGDPITWTLPDGWRRERGTGGGMIKRFATLRSPDGHAEIAVSQASGLVSMNVQRWWVQLWGKEKADEVTAGNVFDFARQRTINGRVVITVDLSGPKDPNAKDPNTGGPMMNQQDPHGGQ